jgi:ferredoxin-NADP reductase
VGLRRTFDTAIVARRQVAQETLEISFERPDGFDFEPGQYVQLAVPKLLHPDRKGRSRVFSIASSPLDEETASVVFRETGSGYKRTLAELEIGSPVVLQGPHGFHTLPKQPSRPVVLVAGGIGITPHLSMLRFATESAYDPNHRITLLYVNRNKQRAAYLDELAQMARRADFLRMRRKFGALDKDFLHPTLADAGAAVWHIAGPPGMVDAARTLLHLADVGEDRVYAEEFVGY